jgi:oligopeptide/dipeptide ABC transporter ATP-binding protein
MQIVFQDPLSSLNARFSVAKAVEEPLLVGTDMSRAERTRRLHEVLSEVNLSRAHLSALPVELTGSELQRVAIARALATNPDLVVLDEPTSNMDITLRAEILALLGALQDQKGTSYLLITHDLAAVRTISDSIAIMYLGRLVEIGSTRDVYDHPRHPYSRGLLSSVLHADPKRPLEPQLLRGEIPTAINPREECPLVGRCPIQRPLCTEAFPAFEPVDPGHQVACYRWREYEAEVMPIKLRAS